MTHVPRPGPLPAALVAAALLTIPGCGSPSPDGPPVGDAGSPPPTGAPDAPIAAETGQLVGLDETAWVLEDLGGRGVVDRARSTVAFDAERGVFGSGGCNRFQGTYRREGAALTLGPLAVTQMACPEAVMDQERAWLSFLETVVRYERTPEGLLLLHADDGSPPARLTELEMPGS